MKFSKSNITIVLFFILFLNDLHAQTIKKSIAFLRNKKYDNAAPALLSAESQNIKKIEVLYGLSLLYAAPNKYQNFGKAAYYFRDATILFTQTTAKERTVLKKDFSIDLTALKRTEMQIARATYNYFAIEGSLSTLKEFYKIFPDYQPKESVAKKDWDIATEGEKLKLHTGFNSALANEYQAFICKAAPKEIAFATLQVLVSPKITKKDWDGAIKIYKEYQDEFRNDNRIAKVIATLKEKSDNNIIKSISDNINSSGNNYAPVLSPDEKKLYFCGRNRVDNLGNEDIFESSFIGDDWSKPVLLKGINTSAENEAPLTISPDNKILITYKKGDLWYSTRNADSSWSEPRSIKEINTKEFVEIDASFSPDGKALFFASDREGNIGTFHHLGEPFNGGIMGNMDIYVSTKINDTTWSTPINLGKTINSNLCERSPFLHPDMKTLYFSSANYGSLGGLDVYKSTRLSDTSWTLWSEPVNLGKNINSVADDFDYKFSADGSKAIFAANNHDKIYIATIELPKKKKQIILVKLLVNVKDSTTNKNLTASVAFQNLTDQVQLSTLITDSLGNTKFSVPVGKLIGVYVSATGYNPASLQIDTHNIMDSATLHREIKLLPIQQASTFANIEEIKQHPVTITLNNILFDFDLSSLKPESFPELDRLVAFVKLYPEIFIVISGHTDNIGDEIYNKNLSENRTISVKNYLVENGCNEKHLKSVGYGKERPIATNSTAEGRKKNRRVELNISVNGFVAE